MVIELSGDAIGQGLYKGHFVNYAVSSLKRETGSVY